MFISSMREKKPDLFEYALKETMFSLSMRRKKL